MRVRTVALLLAGAALWTGGALALTERPPATTAVPVQRPVVDRGTVPAGTSAPAPPRTYGPGTVYADARLRIAVLHADARVVPVRVRHGEMDVPRDPRVVGWWRDGAAPGDSTGTAVLVGHVNYAGVAGAFARLSDLAPGDRIVLAERGTRLRYRVVAVRGYPKSRGLPAGVFARRGPPRLVLITCGGPFDTASGNYEDNVVVWAVPTP